MPKWTQDSVAAELKQRGWFEAVQDIDYGTQFTLTDGTRVNCYNTGKVVVQGRASELKAAAQALFGNESVVPAPTAAAGPPIASEHEGVTPNRVFIVYGHDVQAREQLELLLRRLKLEPIVLQNLPGGGDTIIEKLEELTDADFACVLITPDDEGRKRADAEEAEADLKPRARQNVVLELGMVLARLGRRRVAVLLKGPNMERPSDIDGLIYIQFEKHVNEIKNDLAANLQEAGFNIQVKDLLP